MSSDKNTVVTVCVYRTDAQYRHVPDHETIITVDNDDVVIFHFDRKAVGFSKTDKRFEPQRRLLGFWRRPYEPCMRSHNKKSMHISVH